jgi:Heterokaryon incompatibility protein (HET)
MDNYYAIPQIQDSRERESNPFNDDQFSGPLITTPGLSPLCSRCYKIFTVDHGIVRYYQKHCQDFDKLRLSAQRGCVLCAQVCDTFTNPMNAPEQYEHNSISYDITDDQMKASWDLAFVEHGRFGQCPYFNLLPPLAEETSMFRDPIRLHEVTDNTGSRANELLAQRWLRGCEESHPSCDSNDTTSDFPTRLLAVEGVERTASVQLIETKSSPREGRYITLSHCWGGLEVIKLLTSNLTELQDGISLSRLPKTFQDAVAITKWLGVKYIWIDSLCILQDSPEDWLQESSRMRDVYGYSLCTIAATGAEDASVGCFQDRNPDLVRPIRVRANWETGRTPYLPGKLTCVNAYLWKTGIDRSPLSKRAWAFQERLLSPRILHFSKQQMFWECDRSTACETFPNGLWNKGIGASSASKRVLKTNHGGFDYNQWSTILADYSQGALSHYEDKCIAFAGIVDKVQTLFGGEEYFAGMWRPQMEWQLLWRGETGGLPLPGYVAPSWSWLSMNDSIFVASTPQSTDDIVFKILDVKIQPATKSRLGPIKHGYIRGEGVLCSVVIEQEHRRADGAYEARTVNGHRVKTYEGDVGLRMYVDNNGLILTEYARDLFALPIVRRGMGLLYGLLLVRTNDKRKEFRRVGMFAFWEEDGGWRVLQKEWFGRRRDLPRQEFTII